MVRKRWRRIGSAFQCSDGDANHYHRLFDAEPVAQITVSTQIIECKTPESARKSVRRTRGETAEPITAMSIKKVNTTLPPIPAVKKAHRARPQAMSQNLATDLRRGFRRPVSTWQRFFPSNFRCLLPALIYLFAMDLNLFWRGDAEARLPAFNPKDGNCNVITYHDRLANSS